MNLLKGGPMAARHLRATETVAEAQHIHNSASIWPVLNAALVTNEASVQSVADAFKISSVVVEAYGDLFFNVLDRRDDVVFRRTMGTSANSGSLFLSKSSLPSDEESLLAVGLNGAIADVLRIAGWIKGDGQQSEADLATQMTRKLLQAGTRHLDSPHALTLPLPAIVSHAIGIAKSSKEEQPSPDNVEMDDFATAARAVLSADSLRLCKAVEAVAIASAKSP